LEDTYAVFIPIAGMRWARRGSAWIYEGAGSETEELRLLKDRVTAPHGTD